MEKFIPYEKLSKKEKRRLNAAKRTTWDISPVTRRPENPKAYNRKKTHREFRDDYSVGASLLILLSDLSFTIPSGITDILYVGDISDCRCL